ncbi:aldo/keto reductase [Stappia sp. F7233]|uniref:Aldo/keto reductase n=1 Tax=Stappia albiluteola TaxID=2758565 RepID=A0A839AIA3_9HYPH|nr:aldo/keto reductase [Stappia albiluteola]MBA5779453.1 aldo/keto reductase [Stappia albiluteola]
MEKRKIGGTGLEVTSLSFGGASLGNMPDTYGYPVSEEQAQATVREVFASPVNMLDSSRNYGFGRSEERIGTVIRERGGLPEGFVISTKLDRDMPTGRFDAAQARRSLEESLEALSLDRIPMLHLHDPEHSADLEEIRGKDGALDELFRMKEEGLAQAVGLAMGRLDMMMPLLKDWPFDVLINHNRFTVLNRSADEMYSFAHEAGIAIINAAPFAGGILARGSAQTNRIAYQETDEGGLAPVRAFEALCGRHAVEPGAAALQFSMRDPRITTTLAGVSSPQSIAQNLAWADAAIPVSFWEELEDLPYSMKDPEANRVYRPG